MASIDYMCDVGYAAPPESVQPAWRATSVVRFLHSQQKGD